MTIEELKAKGYTFRVAHHRHEIEVRIDAEHVFSIDGKSAGFVGRILVGICAANYRTDAMEAARVRACGHYVEQRLSV